MHASFRPSPSLIVLCSLVSLMTMPPVRGQSPSHSPSSPWRAQKSPVEVELRGLSVVNEQIAWASGAQGTVLRTVDGETWRVVPVPGAEGLDFRDIEAWDKNTAIALSIGPGESSSVFKTADGGASWRRVFTNSEPTGFWDAIAFERRDRGALFGDPVNGRFQVFTTEDAGESWTAAPDSGMPLALVNEGGFAASGSCLASAPGGRLVFVTGGASESRVFVSTDFGRHFRVSAAPVPAGAPSKGLFSATWLDAGALLVVGGDYKEPALEGVKAALSEDFGLTWSSVASSPGYLSSVAIGPRKGTVVAVGLAGTGFSSDGGRTWASVDPTPYNTAAFARSDARSKGVGFAVGPRGAIARWQE